MVSLQQEERPALIGAGLERLHRQHVSCTDMRLLLKLADSSIKSVKPRLSSNSKHVGDKGVPSLHQRVQVSLFVEVEPSMSEKDIDIKIMLSAIILRTDVKPMEL